MNILLTHGYFLQEDEKEKAIMKPYPPLGILYISAALEEQQIDHDVFDSTFSDFSTLEAYLRQKPPALIGIYTNLMTKLNVLRLIRFLKSEPEFKETIIILGGPEVRHHAENFLQSGADIIVIGEGEQSFSAIVDLRLVRGMKVRSTEWFAGLTTVDGIIYCDQDAQVNRNPERSLLKDINLLPFPNRKKIDLNLYFNAWKNRHGASSLSISTMRGCPYTCKWCSRAVYGQSYRRRCAANVAEEISLLQEQYTFDSIWFVDDVFTISHVWLKEFHDELQKRDIRIRYECITRADRMNRMVIELLKNSGCFRVWIGAESGSQQIIDAMDRRVDVQQVRNMIRETQSAGMQAGTFIMVGYPGETEKDLKETVRHLKESEPDFFTITLTYPIKGTELYSETESLFIHPPEWAQGTDRDIDFQRSYSKKYYHYAIRWIHHEMAYQKLLKKHKLNNPDLYIHKIKSLVSRAGMLWERSGSNHLTA